MIKLLVKYTKDGWWAAILGPIFTIIEVFFDAYIPLVMADIIDVGIYELGGDIEYITKKGIYMVAMALIAALCGALSGLLSSISSTKFVKNIRNAMYHKIQTYDFANIEKFPVSTIVMRLTTDMRMMRLAYVQIVRMAMRAPVNLALSAYNAYKLNSTISFVFAIILPILGLILYLITMISHPRFRNMMLKFDALDEKLDENINGIRVVKTFVREDYENEDFDKSSVAVLKAQRHAENIVILNRPAFELAMYICMIAVAWIGGKAIIGGTMPTGDFMAYLSYVKAILFSLLMLSNVVMQVVMAQASIDRANEVLEEEPSITDENANPDLEVEQGSIEFKNVSFKYSKDAENKVLEDINLKINPGEVVGILGPTGAGKTSLVQLIPRLYDIDSGEILIGGHDIKEYKLEKLRDAIAMVLQKNTLFSGSVRENMKWGNPDASDEEIIEACKDAQAHEFITAHKNGYDRELGQGGTNVSGGQKQRLCIARALLRKPKIIILDDSTSAVDTDTDHRIQLAFKEKLSGMTTIIIAQRVASVKEANRIVIMEDGKIADIGSHDELMERNEVYRDLYTTQMEGAE
ncbi:MAG: ABC transporter ATP-binding protein [Erysipelotrichaceae bacterium]|nr:ABC transporter ATP-binding protein [Erysipelotrichaceae bacterium]